MRPSDERGLAPITVHNYCWHAEQFLAALPPPALVSVSLLDAGTVTAFFADGGSASGQVLVAADGTHSAVRAQYLRELIPKRHLNLRRFCPATNPASGFPLQVTASELAPAWQATNVTLIGDAIHAVTPGPPVGANTALRDAMLLTRALSFVQANRVGLRNAVAAYEAEMVRFDPARAGGLRIPG